MSYAWEDTGGRRLHDKDNFAFQCRYCLIVDGNELPVELR